MNTTCTIWGLRVLVLTLAFFPSLLLAQPPALINYQGRLVNGTNLVNGTVGLTLRLFDQPTGGTLLYADSNQVAVADGLYATTIGDNTIAGSLTDALSRPSLFLEVRVNGTTLSPREPLASVPFALRAGQAQTLVTPQPLASGGSGGAISPTGDYLAQPPLNLTLAPTDVTAVDIKGNGVLDLAIISFSSDDLHTYFNRDNTGFEIGPINGLPQDPTAIRSADINGDGRPDLVVSFDLGAEIAVLMNNGAGGFVPTQTIPYMGGSADLEIGDVNGDGRPDVVAMNSSGFLRVFTNNPLSTLSLASTTNADFGTYKVALADVDNNATLDAVVTSFNSLILLTNNGSGRFFKSATFPLGGVSPDDVLFTDVNRDQRLDLVAISLSRLTILTNNGSGGFAISSTNTLSGFSLSVAAADLNGDSWVDLAVAHQTSNTVTIWTNNRAGGFALQTTLPVGTNPVKVITADLNGDGLPDLACANSSSSSLSIFLNQVRFRGQFAGNGAGLTNAAGWVRNEDRIHYPLGNVGVGTVSPAVEMHLMRGDVPGIAPNGSALLGIESDTNVFIHMISKNEAVTGILFGHPANSLSASMRFNQNGGHELSFRTANSRRLTIQSNGFVAVGTIVATNLFQVNNAYCNGATWVNASDRSLKRDFAPVDSADILNKIMALPILEWTYSASENNARHIGPLAQDFHSTFGLGDNDTSISTIDPAGVALAAIQGLTAEVRSQRSEVSIRVSELEEENARLREELEAIKRKLGM